MTAAEIAEGTVVGGELRVVRCLHTGAFAAVFEAEHVASGDRRALKVVTGAIGKEAKFREVFREEAHKLAGLRSRHVAAVLGSGLDPELDAPFGVMELCLRPAAGATGARASETLSARMERGTPSPHEALAILEQIADALAAAHDAGLAHRDLKPEAVLFIEPLGAPAPEVRLLFLGAAKLASQAKRNTTAAMSRPLWMAPEQAETDVVPSAATDVWAFGLLAYWLLTGKLFWRAGRDAGSAMMTLMREVLYDPIPPASTRAREQDVGALLPPGFDGWFARVVARDRSQRVGHAREAMNALRPLLHHALASAHPAATAPPLRLPVVNAGPTLVSAAIAPQPPKGPLTRSAPRGAGQLIPSGLLAAERPVEKQRSTPRSRRAIALLGGGLLSLSLLAGGLVYWFFLRADTSDHSASKHRDRDDDDDRPRKPRDAPWSDSGCPVAVTSRDPVWGDRSAGVTIVVFSDYGCERCKTVEKTLGLLKREYGPERLRIVWKNVHDVAPAAAPAPTSAAPAALYGQAVFELAGNDGFWKFHDAALANAAPLDAPTLAKLAIAAGVDQATLERRRADDAVARKVGEDAELASGAGVTTAPTLFINGRPADASAPVAETESMVDAAEREAKAERAQGTPAERVYVTLATRNFTPPHEEGAPAKPSPLLIGVDQTIYRVPIGDSPQLGSRAALVTIVEFGDFECPYTRQVQATLNTLLERHEGELRLVWKDNPLPSHKRAEAAAELARFVKSDSGEMAFWRIHDVLLNASPELDESEVRLDAETAGSDADQAMSAITEHKFKAGIRSDQDLAADLGESATPTFYVNGRRLRGAHPLEQFEAVIAEETIRAKKAVAEGTPIDELYDALIRDGKAPNALETRHLGPLPKGAPQRGAKKPKVTIVEFADFQCEGCKSVQPKLTELLSTYGDKLQLVWRNAPLAAHPEAELAAEAALEVKAQLGNDAFWKFHDALFAAQATPGGLERPNLEKLASDAGCDMPKLRSALDSGKHKDAVAADSKDGDTLKLPTEPAFIVGKYLVSGDQPIALFKRAVDKALADAQ